MENFGDGRNRLRSPEEAFHELFELFRVFSMKFNIHPSIPWVQGQNLDRAGTCPAPIHEYLMVQDHSSDHTQAWCRATPVDQNGASEAQIPKSQ